MKRILLPIASLLLFVACDDVNDKFDGLDDMVRPTDVKKIEYTLSDVDYAAIAKDKKNIEIAKTKGVEDELSKLGTTMRFSETLPAKLYVPAFLATTWYTADDGSAVKVTYNKYLDLPEYIARLNGASMYKLAAADYETVWGAGSATNFFTPATPANTNIPAILATAITDAEDGDIVAVDYNRSDSEPSGAVVAINEDFNAFTGTVTPAAVDGWNHVDVTGTNVWQGRTYSGNGYLQASAYNAPGTGTMDAYMITPKVSVVDGMKLTFDACYGNYKAEGGRIEVLVSSNLAGFTPGDVAAAAWDDITASFTIEIPSGTYGDLLPVGEHDLSTYDGQDIYVAFRYIGDKNTDATTTVQIDNVVVKSGGDEFYATAGLFKYNGTAWSVYSGDAYLLTLADFKAMGGSYDNFSSSMNPDNYLPTFLKQKYPYAQIDDKIAATFKYHDGTSTAIRADEYTYSGSEWVKNDYTEVVTDQFVLNNGVWNFDPSMLIILKPGREQPDIALYYQAIVDYVMSIHDTGYNQVGYTNAEYYYGASSYQNNFDFRISAWRNSHAKGSEYAGLNDEALEALMYERLLEAFIPALKANHSDMAPVEGPEVFCTIRFGIYTGSTINECTHEIKYKVTAPNTFEYVQDSFKEL
ncbi:MAG: DUF5017 domain-containing protein [Prevotellaceae bacterium]|jgi:hypothetical protein|nr:DUF5017 domain-containing protein [Prevotellaceae bacterium]